MLGFLIVSHNINSKLQSQFSKSGYILIDDGEDSTKRYMFSAGTKYQNCLSNSIEFKDIQGEKSVVPTESFIHYDNGSISSLQTGVILNLEDLDGNFVNNYTLPENLILSKQGNSYTVENSNNQVTFNDFVYKLSDSKIILVSKELTVTFSPTDIRKVEDFIEINYVDEGIIELVTKENVWRTISTECTITFSNGAKYDLSAKKVNINNTEFSLNQLIVGSDNNIVLQEKKEKIFRFLT